MLDAREARETLADWRTARIVAMLAATNSKREKYDPMKWMAGGAELKRRQQQERAPAEPMTGEAILERFRAIGVPIIDLRAAPTITNSTH